jgi:hypothetical protein
VVGSGFLTDDFGTVRQLEDAGVAVFVLRFMYEEEIIGEQMAAFFHSEGYGESFAEVTSYFFDLQVAFGLDEYLEHLRWVKDAVHVPVLAVLDGATFGGWTSYTHLLEQAGAAESSWTSSTRPATPA